MAGSATNRRLSTSSMTYNGEIMAESIVPVVAQAAGQIEEVTVAVGDSVHEGDLVARIDSKVAEAQRAQAQAALELTQSQLELARPSPRSPTWTRRRPQSARPGPATTVCCKVPPRKTSAWRWPSSARPRRP